MKIHEAEQQPGLSTAFSKERIIALDIARGFAMLLVMMIHTQQQIGAESVGDSLFGGILTCVSSLCAAPVFIFLMGTSYLLSRRASLRAGILRGIKLVALGYLLNFLRGTLPTLSGLYLGLYTFKDIQPYTPLYLMKEVDILQCAGLALIVLAVLRHFVRQWYLWLGAALVFIGLTPVCAGHTGTVPVLRYIINCLWGTERYVYFPLLPWIVYAVTGMIYGQLLLGTKNKAVFFLRSSSLGFVICALSGYMVYNMTDFSMESWFSASYNDGILNPGIVIFQTGFLFILIPFCQYLADHIPWNGIFARFCFWSKEVTLIYCLQWVIIGWLVIFLSSQGLAVTVLCMIGIIILTDRSTVIWNKIQKFFATRNTAHTGTV